MLESRIDTPIVLSYDISPESREFERATTTVMSAVVAPVMARYLGELESRLHGLGIAAPLYVMESAGGILSVEGAVRRSVATVESGPAAGVMAAQALGCAIGGGRRRRVRYGWHDGEGGGDHRGEAGNHS